MDVHPHAELTTERLHLRPLDPADAPALAEAMGRYDVARWLIGKPYPFQDAEASAMIAAAVPGQSWLAWDATHLIGGVSVENGLGFWVARTYWGKGYATEMADAAVRAFFAQSDEDRLLAGAMAHNAASIRVLQKLGGQPLGEDRAWSDALNQSVDVVIYRLTQRLS